jgi:hypothetical protein
MISLMACCISWNIASIIEQKSISQRSLYNSVGRIVLYKEGFETGTFPIECVIESECDIAFQFMRDDERIKFLMWCAVDNADSSAVPYVLENVVRKFDMLSTWRYALEFAVDNERDVRKKKIYERYLLDVQQTISK